MDIAQTRPIRNIIDQNTLVPITVIVIVAGLCFWLARMNYIVERAIVDIAELKQQQAINERSNSAKLDMLGRHVNDMNRTLGSIEGKIEIMVKREER